MKNPPKPYTDLDKDLRIGVLDIETTNLRAKDGRILCACIKDVFRNAYYGPVHTFVVQKQDYSVEEGWNDKQVVKELVSAMNEYDLLVTWYGARFDLPFINTRCADHKIAYPLRQYRRDLWFTARANFLLPNNKLVTWGEFLFGKSGKTRLAKKIWDQVARGSMEGLDYIVEHCEKDVMETEKMYKRFMPLFGKLRRK